MMGYCEQMEMAGLTYLIGREPRHMFKNSTVAHADHGQPTFEGPLKMKLKVQHAMDAMLVVTAIINRNAVMPQRGKYLLARMYSKLLPEYNVIDARRDDMIKAYNNPQTRAEKDPETGDITITQVPGEWQVPPDKMPEFTAAWKLIGDEEIEIDVQPIPLLALSLPNGSDGEIMSSELITLGDLVFDNVA